MDRFVIEATRDESLRQYRHIYDILGRGFEANDDEV